MQSNEGFLKEKFSGSEVQPGADVWGNVAAALDKKERKKRAIVWWFTGLAASLAITWAVWPNDNFDASSIQSDLVENEVELPAYGELECIAKTQSSTLLDSIPFWNSGQFFLNYNFDWNQNMINGWNNYNLPFCGGDNWSSDNFEMKYLNNPPIEKIPTELAFLPSENADLSIGIEKEKKQKSKWFKEIEISSFAPVQKMNKVNSNNYDNTTAADSTTLGFSSLDPSIDYSYIKPIEAKFMIGKNLGKHWSFRTGLGVNVLLQKWSEGNVSKQNLYVNAIVPVNLRFHLNIGLRNRIFIGAGLQAETPIYSKLAQENTYLESLDKKPFQAFIGAHTELGWIWHINDKSSLIAGPNLRYVPFQLGKTAGTITQPKWWLGANIAFRF